MSSITQPKRHHHHHLHHRSGSYFSQRSFSAPTEHSVVEYPHVFQGTDAVPQNQKVALQRVIDTHHALELKYGQQVSTPTSTTSDRPTSSSSSIISNDPFTMDFRDIPFPDAEVQAFHYLLRLWDARSYPLDPEFDAVIAPRKAQFDEQVVKHFFSRVALWDASEEEHESMSRSVFFFRRRRRSRAKSVSQTLNENGQEEKDALKEITTREGLAQLVWTLLHDPSASLDPGLRDMCTEALKEMYHVRVMAEGGA